MIDALTVIGIASLAFTAAFTVTVARAGGGSGQSRRSSLIEAWANIGIGFGINLIHTTAVRLAGERQA